MILTPRSLAAATLRSGSIVLLAPALATPAAAQVRAAADVSVQGTAASGVSLADRSGDGALSAAIQVDPSVYYRDGEVTTAVLRGSASVEQYTGDLGTAVSVGVNGNVQHRLGRTTMVGLSASLSSTRSAVRDFLRRPVPAADVLKGLDPTLLQGQGPDAGVSAGTPDILDPNPFDPSLPDFLEAGLGGRTTSTRLGGTLDQQLTARDALSLAGSVRWNNATDLGASDYRSEEVSAFYGRELSPRATLRAGATAGWVNYDGSTGGGSGDGSYVTPTLALSLKLSEATTASAALGATLTRVEGPLGARTTHTGLAGRFEVCTLQYRGTLCANASRNVQPTSFAGLTTVTSAGLSYGRAFGLEQRVSLAAAYTRRSADLFPGGNPFDGTQSLLAVSGRYARSLDERVEAFVAPGYARIWGGAAGGQNNYQISVGVRYRLGRLK